MLATVASLVLQVPLLEVLAKVDVEPLQIAAVPVIAAGAVFTKTDAVEIQSA